MTPGVELQDWGVVDYAEALERQVELFDRLIDFRQKEAGATPTEVTNPGIVQNVQTGERSEEVRQMRPFHENTGAGYIVLCEHPHVYTLGKSGKVENLLVNEAHLREKGANFYRVDRGGDITYHGPGQIVIYPVMDLEKLGLGLREYIAALEQSAIDTVAEFGIEAGRKEGATGVWIKDELQITNYELRGERKICAIGVKASRGVVMHGAALNVGTDLGWFELINPCGVMGARTTSIEAETGARPAMKDVKRALVENLSKNLKINIESHADRKTMGCPPAG